GDGCNVNLDSVAVTQSGDAYPTTSTTPAPPADVPGQLGGWTRGLDAYPNQAGTDIGAYTLHPGLLNKQGWTLLDDTYTALRTPAGWATPRPAHDGAYQDGYFFGYGHDYKQALSDLRALTGPADLLPEWAFGVWFSEYNAFTTSQYENDLVPAFRSHDVPLDTLVVDTDWKSPQQWDGWNWNPNLFADPQAFLDWAKAQHLKVTLNVHAGIDASDPKFAQTQATAGGTLQHAAQCFSPDCYRFDWSNPQQAKAWFDLHQSFEQQGVRQWWLDWCCTDSYVGMSGLTPDSWINSLYAQDLTSSAQRGFNLARIGASFEDYRGAPASGPWGEHRSTVAFTGDTDPTWAALDYAAKLAPAEASIGLPYVSNDIGSFKGKHLPDDLYTRWVQLGAFSPILRLHSDHGDRLPWQYGAGQQPATDALRLREALLPYTYSLAWQAHRTGLPITRPLYLDYPDQAAAYDDTGEYLYGPDVLVAPVTTPGAIATQHVWFPPGRWVDYFTGATYQGPSTADVQVPLSRMPVFVKAGGIVPEAPGRSHVDTSPSDLTLKVFAGDSGTFVLHSDTGEGMGYRSGQYADTRIGYLQGDSRSSVVVSADRGSYPGQQAARSYNVDLADVSAPQSVSVDGKPLPDSAWSYDTGAATLHVRTDSLSTARSHVISQSGGSAIDRAQSPAVALSLDPATPLTLAPGATTTVTAKVDNGGPGSVSDLAVSLHGPDGWTIAPSGDEQVGTVNAGGSGTATWTVTAPSGGSSDVSATLWATATYTNDGNGSRGSVTTYQGPPSNLPPVITSIDPTSAAAGDHVTLHGTNFGATQADPSKDYVFFINNNASWGAPFDGATFHVLSWSDTAITFEVPDNPGEPWQVASGTTAYVSVYTDAGQSNQVTLQIK
ncbi:MAG TPA: TIM-barrel domain-containing protein, partial [Jatrophihabitans sp.]|nr:TIM-barrel domain-containing protein [Jatrophihabitans sp.]